MKKFLSILPLAALALASCSSDEPLLDNEQPQIPTFSANQAVVSINILNPEALSRAGVNESNPSDYHPGSADENKVNSINFYFYDKAGDYVTKYENATFEKVDEGNPLVSAIGRSKIVLTDLLGQNYPSYVVAVINAPTTLNLTGKTLSQAYDATLAQARSWATANGKANNFIMTSATNSDNASDFNYFATPVREENFAEQNGEQGDDWNSTSAVPVDMYVERLASKIELSFDSDNFQLTADGSYEMELPDNYSVDGVDRKLRIQVLGWGVNGVAKSNYFFKHLNATNPFMTADGWDFSGTHRCYWSQTPGYGTWDYPSSFGDVDDKGTNGSSSDAGAHKEKLTFISYADVLKNPFKENNFAYVPANTERGEKINLAGNTLNHAALTEVLLAARIVDNDGNPMTLFQLSDSYYTRDGVLSYLLNAAGLHVWKKVETDGKVAFRSIEISDVDVAYGYDGTFSITIANPEVTTWFKDNTGTTSWKNAKEAAAYINSFLPDQQSFCFNEGRMYYNIPIRHLRPMASGAEVMTGHYGVVRNHWYKLNVTSLGKLGHSVYRPEEHIIPNSDNTRYMIGSTVKVLAWRIVNQTVEI